MTTRSGLDATGDRQQRARARVRRTAITLSLVALAVYVGFILMAVLQSRS